MLEKKEKQKNKNKTSKTLTNPNFQVSFNPIPIMFDEILMCVVSSAVNKTENKKSPDEITEIEKLGSFQVRTGKPNITIQKQFLLI